MINIPLLKIIESSKSKILVVTKYWDKNITLEIIKEISKNYSGIFF
jgi:hypothetical protein